MNGVLFDINGWEMIKGVWPWFIGFLSLIPWQILVFLLIFEIFNLVFNRLLPKRRVYSSAPARHIPQEVKDAVWDRDGGRCVKCRKRGFGAKIHFDHIIPFSKGGSNTVENIEILCQECNLKKSNKIGSN